MNSKIYLFMQVNVLYKLIILIIIITMMESGFIQNNLITRLILQIKCLTNLRKHLII
jgi:hypothetical protein